jgi:indole-3-glycerol phosphate synthase
VTATRRWIEHRRYLRSVATYLDRILAHHRRRTAADTRSLDALLARLEGLEPARGFARALVERDGLAVIAEIKRRSPSKGVLLPDLDPAVLAHAYARGGASCLSVLTDGPHFDGSPADLRTARAAVDLPVLRKDFTVGPLDVVDARLMGADAVLLIAAALDDTELVALHTLAVEVGLDALVEIHDEVELDRALTAGAVLVGVNQRDLVTFDVDGARAARMAPLMPAGVVRVAESGVRDRDDARALRDAGYDAVLVGEALVTSGDPEAATREMRSA